MEISEIKRVVKSYNPDIIHAHDFRASVICAFANVSLPVISHLHNNSPWLKKYGFYSFIYLFASFRFKKILLVSSSIMDEYVFSRFIKDKIKLVSNPIHVNAIVEKAKKHNPQPEFFDIIFVGRLTVAKNPLRFIKIMNNLINNIPTVTACIVGSGELEAACKYKIEQLHLTNHITFTGFLENPYPIMASSKLLCMTSDWEGFGLVAIEAFSLGLPVVASPVGGLINIVNSSSGKLCETNNEYILELKKLLSDSVYYKKMSEGALLRAKELDNFPDYCGEIERIYKNIY
jgi:glycosyltransferase involved in cell wall biosynthesis